MNRKTVKKTVLSRYCIKIKNKEKSVKMKKGQFVTSIVLFILTAACCVFANLVLGDSYRSMQQDSAAGIALIVIIPVTLILYAVQLVTGAISLGLSISCCSSESRAIKVASIILAVAVVVLAVVSIAIFVWFVNSANSGSSAVIPFFAA